MTTWMIKNLKYPREVEEFNENPMKVHMLIKDHITPPHIPKGKAKDIRPGGPSLRSGFTKLTFLILKGLTTSETNVHLTTFKAHCNKLIVLMRVLLPQTKLIEVMHHKPTTLDILNEYNHEHKVFTPYNVYVLALNDDSCISYFLELVQFRAILGLFGVFLPNICKGKQMKQIPL